MEGLYEKYKKYCPPLSEREKAQIEEERKKPQGDVWKKEAEIGYNRAVRYLEEWRDKGMVYPDIPDALEQFPGIDPKGCYTEIDLSCKSRIQKLLGACQSRPAPIRELTETSLANIRESGLYGMVESYCKNIQNYRMAQKMSPSWQAADENVSKEERNRITLGGFLSQIEDVLGGLEYINGLSDRKPDLREVMRIVGRKEKHLAEILESRNLPATAEQGLNINFMDLDSMVAHKYFSNPLSLGKGPQMMHAKSADGVMENYAPATADRVLNPAFSRGETDTFGRVNRMDLIIVDGRTVGEILAEKEQKTPRKPNMTTDELNEYRRQQANEIVAAGLMADKRVEAFLPDERGRIPKEPVQITKSGYEPSPLKKVTLNAWERYFSKHGFFKEKAAKAVEYQRFMEARERVRQKNRSVLGVDMQHPASRNIKEMFFSEWVENNGPIPNSMAGSFSTGRGALTTAAVCAMLNRGYQMEDILDPEKLADVKLKVGTETADRMQADDKEWIAETFYKGRKALIREMDRLADFDISDSGLMFSEKAAPLRFAAQVTFDLGQEADRIKPQMLAEAEKDTPGRGMQTLEEHYNAGDSAAAYVDTACGAMEAVARYSEAGPENRSNMVAQIAKWEYARKLFAQRRAANPQARITGIAKGEEYIALDSLVRTDSAFQEVAQRLSTDEEFAASVGRAISGGELGKRMQMTFDRQNVRVSFQIDSMRIEKAASRDVRLQETVKKNEAQAKEKRAEGEQNTQEKADREQQKTGGKAAKAAKAPGRRR